MYEVPELGKDINHTIFGSFTLDDDDDDNDATLIYASSASDSTVVLCTSYCRKWRVTPLSTVVVSNKLLYEKIAIPSMINTDITMKITPSCKQWLPTDTLPYVLWW